MRRNGAGRQTLSADAVKPVASRDEIAGDGEVLAGGTEGADRPALLRDRTAVEGRAAAYVCENFACRAPVTEPGELDAALS